MNTRSALRWLVLGTGLAWTACGGPGEQPDDSAVSPAADPSAADPAPAPDGDAGTGAVLEVVLFDTIPWEGELAAGQVYRVGVRTAAGIDTLAEVTAESPPILVGGSAVHGLDAKGAAIDRGFVWRAETGEVESVELPPDFAGFLAHALAPDARHLAYVGKDADGLLRLVVRSWPGGEPVYQSHAVHGYPSDARNSEVTWTGPEGVELRVRLDVLDPARESWLVARGRPATGALAADTLVLPAR